MQFINFISALLLSFIFFEICSNPDKDIHHKIPKLKVKSIELFPFRIYIKSKIIHIHHWMYFSVLLVITIFYNPILIDTVFAKGALLGGIAQGLTFPDWKTVIKKRS